MVWSIKFIKYTEKNKLIVRKYAQNVRLWHEHKDASVLAIGQLHHQSATAPSCTTHAVDAVAAHRCHELWTRTHVAEWQTKWHNPSDLGLVSSVVTCLALWNLEWCVVAVQLCHVHDGHVYVTNKINKLTTYSQRAFIPVSRYVKIIKIHQDFPKLWSQMCCHFLWFTWYI